MNARSLLVLPKNIRGTNVTYRCPSIQAQNIHTAGARYMKQLDVVVSLPGDNKYLREQALVAQASAQRLGMKLRIINAGSDPVVQSQQLLEIIQSSRERPDAIIIEPVNETGLPRVAEAAVHAGIAWIVSNARVDYLEALRTTARTPIFSVSQDHGEIGRLQGKQFGVLLPHGGSVLYLRGPSSNSLACQRAEGVESATPHSIQLKTMKIQWTEESAYHSVSSWLRLSTVHAAGFHLVSSQNIDFIAAAKRAFQDNAQSTERQQWLSLLYTGAGVASQTKPLVDKGILTAAVFTSLTMDTCLEMLHRAIERGSQPAERTMVSASSYPSLEELAKTQTARVVPRAAGN
jgi:ABC-type sugar transport system substrate-binding protein